MEITVYTSRNQIMPERGLSAVVAPDTPIRDVLVAAYGIARNNAPGRAGYLSFMLRSPQLRAYPVQRTPVSYGLFDRVDLLAPISELPSEKILLERRQSRR